MQAASTISPSAIQCQTYRIKTVAVAVAVAWVVVAWVVVVLLGGAYATCEALCI